MELDVVAGAVRALDVVAGAVRALDDAHATTIVEGAGGLLVRPGAFTLLDVAVALRSPVVVVVAASGLSTLNHAELTVAALIASGVDCRGVVVGSWPAGPGLAERCNLVDLPLVTGVPLLGVVPTGAGGVPGPVPVSGSRRRWAARGCARGPPEHEAHCGGRATGRARVMRP